MQFPWNRMEAELKRELEHHLHQLTAEYERLGHSHEEAILMAKNGVRGVFDGDPRTNPSAEFLPVITHLQAIERGLKVMDTTALSLCMDNHLPIHVFELKPGNIGQVVAGESVGTLISTPSEGGRE